MGNIVSSISSFVSSFFTAEPSTAMKPEESNVHETTDHTTEGPTSEMPNRPTTEKLDAPAAEGDHNFTTFLVSTNDCTLFIYNQPWFQLFWSTMTRIG